MSIGSVSLSGENCILSIQKMGDTGSVDLSIRITGVSANGFERTVSPEKTFGTMLHNYGTISPATVQLSFLYDIEEDWQTGSSMWTYVGSTYMNDGIRHHVLQANKPSNLYKVKLEMNEYTGSFGTLSDDDQSLRMIFYNAFGTQIQTNVTADSEVQGTLTFRCLPFNPLGSSNYIELEKAFGADLAELNSAESSYDSTMGY